MAINMFDLLVLGLASAASVVAQGPSISSSPAYNYMFDYPVPIPAVASPEYTEKTSDGRTINFYSVTIESFSKNIYPNLGNASLVGYNGTAPGPTYMVERGTETIIRYYNKGSTTSAVHLHGAASHPVWDGWASDLIQVGQYKDYYYANDQSARPIWYHDHADGHTASDAYYGQSGLYIIHDPAEDALGLPKGKYDVPLAISDKAYQSNGNLASPTGNAFNFFGDVIEVNGQPWPYMSVEPRKYRLRFYDMSLSRPYSLYFADPSGNKINFQVIASDSGLFGNPVTTSSLTIAMGERYEVVVDFSSYTGKNITLGNSPITTITSFSNTDKVMRFVVGKTVSDSTNNGAVPSTLNANLQFPTQLTTVDHTFNFQLGGDSLWTINGVSFSDANNRVLARPPQGTVELWELHHTGGPAVHPVHVHLVDFQVVSRTGGTRGVLPYETAGLKDVVLLEPGETVKVLAHYGPWNGLYMFHCHNLIHEDNAMMDVFNVTALAGLGYTSTSNAPALSNPINPQYAAKAYAAAAFQPAAIKSAVSSYAALSAYNAYSALQTAEAQYYSTAGYNGDATTVTGSSTTRAASSSGANFPSTTATASLTATQKGPPAPTKGQHKAREFVA